MPPVKKAKPGRPAANRVTKPAPNATATKRRSSDRLVAAAEEAIVGRRTGAGAKPDNAAAGVLANGPGRGRGRKRAATAEQVEEEDAVMTEAPAPDVATPPATKQKGSRGRPKKTAVEIEPQPTGTRRGKRPPTRDAEPEAHEISEIPETQQQEAMQSDAEDGHDDLADLPLSQSPDRAKSGRGGAPVPSSVSKRPLQPSSPEKGEPALRRRLGEMTQKYESMELKYRDLKEIALISTLKAELAAQKEAAKEIQRLKKQLEASEHKAETLQSKVSDLTKSLTESQSEVRSLNLKLAAARNAEAAATAAAKVPGSAIKGATGAASRLAAASASEAIQQATLAAQKKEDLYGDLTGLIIRSVKREGGEDVFDCIQTGRNGTLHFKLAVDVDTAEGGGSGEAHCQYTPQLDQSRDRALIDVLPSYLVEEISFPQTQAGKFYARVLKALNE
ncbi:uncharacterized protein THITE_2043583 [Thermothielavioides terrestris NRRL 8126]|uniref:Monopolin complex subunit Csm1/Pcs1 C-terminal domain-containing protein n=2 Tax=Thermothielavioides terrestris TaxID=2587410 RepID=G2R2Z9_THETT|nr:uncharacterized protein THITE_2043583 [Thermothielavioides terrestris NRRL 8126]AEO66717.1 hypothetical protein THITE_2043583 [Thermothielavioides terrestris NRRL 8126]